MFKKMGVDALIRSNTAAGVEVVVLQDGALELNVLTLKKTKSDLGIDKKQSGITDVTFLKKMLDAKTPIILVINGKGIIHRKVTTSENDSQEALLNKVLPNANISEFYIQRSNINASQAYISVVRSSVVDDIIDLLQKHGIDSITGCLLGPFVINHSIPIIDKQVISNEFLSVGSHKLLIREDAIHEVQTEEVQTNTNVKVGDDLLEGKLLVAFSAALSYFIGSEQGILNSTSVDALKLNFGQKQKFYFFGWTLLVATFLILIVNYFAFNHYWEKSNDLNSKLVLNQSALKRYESLKTEYNQKKVFLEQNGLLENSRTSYYADQLAASLPASIQLIQLNIHPLKKKEVTDLSNAFFFENKIIVISGKCNRNTELNDWMKRLKENKWVERVNLLNYKQENAKEDGLFFIQIELR